MKWFSAIEEWPTMEEVPVLLIVMNVNVNIKMLELLCTFILTFTMNGSGNSIITKGITSRKGIDGLFKITDKNLKHRNDLSVTYWTWADD